MFVYYITNTQLKTNKNATCFKKIGDKIRSFFNNLELPRTLSNCTKSYFIDFDF